MSSILFITLLLVAYLIFRLYSNLDYEQSNQYTKLEAQIEQAAIKYVNARSNYTEGTITLNDLKQSGYIDMFTDDNGNSCNGYVIYKQHEYTSFISCEYYTTKNYKKSLDK